MRIPTNAPPEVQEAFREVWQSIDRVSGSNNVDFKGRRVINAGWAVDPNDYVVKAELFTDITPGAKGSSAVRTQADLKAYIESLIAGVAGVETPPTVVYRLVEIDFGATPVAEGTFVVSDLSINSNYRVLAQVAYIAPTDKDLDELEFDGLDLKCVVGVGSVTIYARPIDGGLVADKFNIFYIAGK